MSHTIEENIMWMKKEKKKNYDDDVNNEFIYLSSTGDDES